ncbi:MAG: 3-phosphoglycerate kinase [Rhodospirillales bacterium 69-11]|nr:MAG: 3-phosphoglycerate kinase [Rhodospirillales bacterium 69-11]
MASPGLSEIVTSTLENRSKDISDAFTNNTALMFRLNDKGNKKLLSGGRTIVREIAYAENGTFGFYSGYDTLNVSPSDVFTAAEYNWKQAAVAVSWSGLEQLQNSGPEQVFDLIEERITNAESTMVNNLSDGLYSDGTGFSGKQVGGLQLLVSDAGTGTVGGINAGTWDFWQNYVYSFAAQSGAPTPGPTTIQRAMNTTWLSTKRNRDQVDLIVADNIFYSYYWESLQAQQRFMDAKMASAGFDNLKFKNADVVADGGLDGDAPASRMYFLNTKYLRLEVHKQRDMVPLGPGERSSVNQDATVKLLGWAGNMTTSNRRLQGVIRP